MENQEEKQELYIQEKGKQTDVRNSKNDKVDLSYNHLSESKSVTLFR